MSAEGTFTTSGDGEVHTDATLLVTELFDATMSTWRWVEQPTAPEESR
jgi:hypothetical protein